MDPKQQAEWNRLHAALNNGPGRRMVDDTLAGRGITRADEVQSERYRRLMSALQLARPIAPTASP